MKKYWIVALLLTSMPAWAILPYGATPAEQAMCQARVYSRLEARNENTQHMHHYCDGLRFYDRALAAMGDKEDRAHYMNESIGNFNYVLDHTREDYVMRGEVHVGKARTLKLAGKKGEATSEYFKALRYLPNASAIYQALADLLQDMGDKRKALEVITEGLKQSPDSKGLKRRYTELGGKLPYPEAVAKTIPAEMAGAQVKPKVSLEATPSPGEVTSQALVGTKLAVPIEPTSPQIESPKTGSPKDPYCRFCPPEE
jgi:tetratricopeptide (TPR) repeat protein